MANKERSRKEVEGREENTGRAYEIMDGKKVMNMR